MDRIGFFVISAIAMIALGVGGYVFLKPSSYGSCALGSVAGEAAIGGPFELIDQTGQSVTSAQLITGPSLIYFGYTFCPDVCPFDVSRNVETVDILKEKGVNLRAIFITVDPLRDTVPVLSDYAEAMHPEMIALTGSEAQIKTAAGAYKVFYRKHEGEEDYLVDHSAFSYLMDPSGFRAFFRRDLTARELADEIACVLKA